MRANLASTLTIIAGLALLLSFAVHSQQAAHSQQARTQQARSQPESRSNESEISMSQSSDRPRARELGITIGVFSPGEHNAITDVAGVQVGHHTMNSGDSLRTGVTAIRPHGGNVFQQKVPAAAVVGNGFGKLVGVTQVQELGLIETPILLTNTLSTFAAADALVAYTLELPGNEDVQSVNPVVGECNDGFLNEIRAQSVGRDDVLAALSATADGPVPEGCVGAGTGTQCLGFKGGIGTSSRVMPESMGGYTVGVLVQTNFGGVLNVDGAPVGEALGVYSFRRATRGGRGGRSGGQGATTSDEAAASETTEQGDASETEQEHGSCIVVVATDAPLDARQLERLARRALLGLAAVGSPMTHGSGDYVIAFSAAEGVRVPYSGRSTTQTTEILRDDRMSPLFQGVKEATEEAVLNSLFKAETTHGRDGRVSEAIPIDRVVEICRQHGVIQD